jgi:outer membrane protein OmpA-like peptidoglycan-associated protein
MNASIMDSVRGLLTSDTLGKAADFAGEPPDATRKVAQGAVPTIFAGLAQRASTPEGASTLFGTLRESGGAGGAGQLVSKVFGDRLGAVGDALGQSSRVSGRSASRVLTFLMPLVAGILGKHIISNRLDARGLSTLLLGQRKAILDDPNTPRGLSGALGMKSMADLGGAGTAVTERYVSSFAAPDVSGSVPPHVHTGEVRPRSAWLPTLVAVLGAAALALVLGLTHRAPAVGLTAPQPNMPAAPQVRMPQVHGPQVHAPQVEAPQVEAPHVQAPQVQAPSAPNAPHAGPVTLPGGQTLDVGPDSPTADMARTLGDSSKPLPQTFQFGDLSFESGSAIPTASSTKTVDDLAAMLQAYPSSRVRIGGHTDSVGNQASNLELSKWRASYIKSMLVQRGIAADRIETVGESANAPVAPNESEQGRAENRQADIELLSR